MSKYVVLFNAKAGNGRGKEQAESIKEFIKGEIEFANVLEIKDYKAFFSKYDKEAKFVICGGDGTLNHFINDVAEKDIPDEIYYFAAGSGNDFATDIGLKVGDAPVNIKKYLVGLPTCTIKGKDWKFLNGIGYGIDGYCCEVGDQLRATTTKPINYAGIAIGGLLGKFKPANAKVTVDGKEYTFKKVWLAPIMHGRFYGGGMIPTPDQDRLKKKDQLSVLIWHGSGKLPTLMAFPGIFKGEHLKKEKMCQVITGKKITVEFDKHGIAAQVDGETVVDVVKVEAHC